MNGSASNDMMLAILAAGQSQRFGEQDKLTALLHGKMLGLHAADAFAAIPFARHIVIVSQTDHPCAAGWLDLGYELVVNRQSAEGQSASVRLAAKTARLSGATALCIGLADMPFVTGAHIADLLKAYEESDQSGIVASAQNGHAMPPALFPASHFAGLESLAGDGGARKFLHGAQLIEAREFMLMDIDTPDRLARLNRQTGLPRS